MSVSLREMHLIRSPRMTPDTPSERSLVRRVLANDRAAFDLFFNTYFARVYRFCAARLGNDHPILEDIVQEVMTKAIRGLPRYRGEASLFTWLCQIARNELASWYRRDGKREERLVSIDDDAGVRAVLESLSFGDEADRIETGQLVQLVLDYLPGRYGDMLEWKYVDGLSVDEIAARLGVTSISVQSTLARARRAFRNAIAELEQEVGSHGD